MLIDKRIKTFLNSIVRGIVLILLGILPLRKRDRIYISIFNREGVGGPRRFIANLENSIKKKGWGMASYSVSGCRSALIMSNSPGDYFHKLCRIKDVRTVLRVDGFYLPMLFDNKAHKYRSTRVLDAEKIFINKRLQKDLILSDWVVYQSNFSKEMSDTYLYDRTENYSIIYNGVDTDYFRPSKKTNNLRPVLLLLGSWRDTDIISCSLRTFTLVGKQIDCSLRIIGSMTGEVEDVYRRWLSENKGHANDVEWLGNVSYSELPGVIDGCDIGVHLKSGDWCPNAVLEALACGLPIVYHAWGGVKELVGDAGIVIDSQPYLYDETLAEKAAEAVLVILKDKDRFSAGARKRVEQLFKLGLMVEQYLKVMDTKAA